MRACNYFAVISLFFGAALAAFVSGSLEERVGNSFCFGLIPAVGFYIGGYVLSQLLVFGVKLCDTIIARCSQHGGHLANGLLSWAGAHVSNWLAGDVHTKPNAEGPNGDEFGLEVRRGLEALVSDRCNRFLDRSWFGLSRHHSLVLATSLSTRSVDHGKGYSRRGRANHRR
jgi:hypothetical protein